MDNKTNNAIRVKVKLPDDLMLKARQHAEVCNRTLPKQIEYWSRIGKVVEENPDLPYSFIKDILLAKKEVSFNQVTSYT